jgi:hypothetical protein
MSGGSKEKHENFVRITNLEAEILTQDLPDI